MTKKRISQERVIAIQRVPAENGEWMDLHLGRDGRVNIVTTGYANIKLDLLQEAIKRLTTNQP